MAAVENPIKLSYLELSIIIKQQDYASFLKWKEITSGLFVKNKGELDATCG